MCTTVDTVTTCKTCFGWYGSTSEVKKCELSKRGEKCEKKRARKEIFIDIRGCHVCTPPVVKKDKD
ncbi:hypothetical protein QQZ08_011250, partial [Neonectria magnoliae]